MQLNHILNKMNKKAISENVMLWIPRMFFLAIVVITIIFLTRFIVAIYIQTADAQAGVYINKIMYDKNGIIRAYNDRSYPGVIDMAKFSGARLDKTMKFEKGEEGPCAKLTLKNIETGTEKTIFWNRQWYERLRPRAAFRGIGAPFSKEEKVLVSIYENGRYTPAVLSIDMVVPRK